MQVINIEMCLPGCTLCKKIEKEQIRVAQQIALFFEAGTLKRRRLNGFENTGVRGVVKSIRTDDEGKLYSVKFENSILSEFIFSGIEKINLLCSECAINNT